MVVMKKGTDLGEIDVICLLGGKGNQITPGKQERKMIWIICKAREDETRGTWDKKSYLH